MWSSQLYLQFKQQQILAQRTFSAPPCSALPTGDPNVCMGADQFIEFIFTRYILATGKDGLDKLVMGSNPVEPWTYFFRAKIYGNLLCHKNDNNMFTKFCDTIIQIVASNA